MEVLNSNIGPNVRLGPIKFLGPDLSWSKIGTWYIQNHKQKKIFYHML